MPENPGINNLYLIEQIPTVTARNEKQADSIVDVGLAAQVVQTIDNKSLFKSGFNKNAPMDRSMSDLMKQTTDEALSLGADEYSIMSAIHSGTQEAPKNNLVDTTLHYLGLLKNLFFKNKTP